MKSIEPVEGCPIPPSGSLKVIGLAMLAAVLLYGCKEQTDDPPPTKDQPATPPTAAAATIPDPPDDLNILLITLDTTRADALGCYGTSEARTPNLDRLAAEGARFTRCSACTPLTAPSHSTMMTGTYPLVHGVRQNVLDRLGDENVTLAEILKGEGLATTAVVASFVLKGRFGLAQGFDRYDDHMRAKQGNPAGAERTADEVSEAALAWLGRLAGKRFFLWVHFYDPHYPYESEMHTDPASPEAYADEVEFMDRQIGHLLDALQEHDIIGRTLVVAVGDHGEGLGDHGESEHGYLVYETTMHVPLLVWCPGLIPAGVDVEPRVRTVDLLPTVLDFIGLESPDAIQGRSLRPLIYGQESDEQRTAYGETFQGRRSLGLSELRCWYLDDWKYVHSACPQLYDLSAYPDERMNLIGDHPERAKALRQQLLEFLATATAGGLSDQPAEPTAQLSEQDRRRLGTLGYVTVPAEEPDPDSAGCVIEHMRTVEQFARAHRLMAAQEYEQAVDLLREVVAELPRASAAWEEFSRACRRSGRIEQFEQVCKQAANAHPEAIQPRLQLARLLRMTGRQQEAVAAFEEALKLDWKNGDLHLELAVVLGGLGLEQQAHEHLVSAVEFAPNNSTARHALGTSLARRGEFKAAVEHLRRAVEIQPNSARFRRDLKQVEALMQDAE